MASVKIEMTPKEAIEIIRSNYPDSRYSMLQNALDMAIEALEEKVKEQFSETKNYVWG